MNNDKKRKALNELKAAKEGKSRVEQEKIKLKETLTEHNINDNDNMDDFIEQDDNIVDYHFQEEEDDLNHLDIKKNEALKHENKKKDKKDVKVSLKEKKNADNILNDLLANINDSNSNINYNKILQERNKEIKYGNLDPEFAPNTFNHMNKNKKNSTSDALNKYLANVKKDEEIDQDFNINNMDTNEITTNKKNIEHQSSNKLQERDIILNTFTKRELGSSAVKPIKRKLIEDDDEDDPKTLGELNRTKIVVESNDNLETNKKVSLSNIGRIKESPSKIDSLSKNLSKIDVNNSNTSNQQIKNFSSIEKGDKIPITKDNILITPTSNFNEEIVPNSTIKNNELLPVDNSGNIMIFWYDAHEEPSSKQDPEPKVILFGKVKESDGTYSSIAVVIKKLVRTCFLFPKYNKETKTYSKPMDMFKEFEELRKQKFNYIDKISSKPVKKKYAFELPIEPGEHTVLKIKFDAKFSIPDITGTSFSCIFGKKANLLENVLIKLKLKGPSWIKIEKDFFKKSSSNSSLTWCKHEIVVEDFKKISNVEFEQLQPPLKLFCFSAHFLNMSGTKELASISCIIKNSYNLNQDYNEDTFCENDNVLLICRKMKNFNYSNDNVKKLVNCQNVILVPNENTLINIFIQKITNTDPDIMISHNLYNNLENILGRISKLKVSNWSKIGKIKREFNPKNFQSGNNNMYIRACMVGRLLCDTFISCRDILRESNYDLDFLSKKYLEKEIEEIEPTNLIENINQTNAEGILSRLLKSNFEQGFVTLELMHKMKILQLTLQLTNIAGNLWIKSLQNSRADRCEMMLMHEFYSKGYLYPDKLESQSKNEKRNFVEDENDDEKEVENTTSNKRKPQYGGGLVLEPKAGLYDTIILLLDFNSLYPSIIQEYNICFTTLSRRPTQTFSQYNSSYSFQNSNVKSDKKKKKKVIKNEDDHKSEDASDNENEENETNDEINLNSITTKEKAILPLLLESLVKKRREIKQEMKNEKNEGKLQNLDIKQKAVKLSANSLYGFLGYKNSRFYVKSIAALITETGRNILQNTVKLVHDKHSLEVIYGDTDSIMINSRTKILKDALELGSAVKKVLIKIIDC